MTRLSAFTFLLFASLLSGCAKEFSSDNGETGNVTLSFSAVVKAAPLAANQQYTNDWGENYTVTTFKYYLHDISLVNARGEIYPASADYYLVDDAKPETKSIALRVPAGEYTHLRYTLGVDSARNVSGAQTGVLDPVNGMFWTWSSGYVMAKLEGLSAAANSANGNFTYHIGGFKQPEVASKQIDLTIPTASKLQVLAGATSTVDIQADINTWFGNVNPIKISVSPACHSPGPLAKQIADNYAGMFSISGVR